MKKINSAALALILTATSVTADEIAQGFGEDIPLSFAIEQIVPESYMVSYGRGVDPTLPVSWRGGESWKNILSKLSAENGLDFSYSHDSVTITARPHHGSDEMSRGLEVAGYGQSLEIRKNSYADDLMAGNGTLVFGATSKNSENTKKETVGFELIDDDGIEPIVPTKPPLPDSIYIGIDTDQLKPEWGENVWPVFAGSTLEDILMEWGDKAGWEVVWNSDYSYPIEASAEFKGSFIEVTSKLVNTISKSAPPIKANFYKGNNVLVLEAVLDGKA